MRKKTGSSLLGQFQDTALSIADDADHRQAVVNERIVELESELADLLQLHRRLNAALGTS